MYQAITINPRAEDLRIALAVSRYHAVVTDAMRDGAIDRFRAAGGSGDKLIVVPTPGAFELIAVCDALSAREDVDGIVAIGCVITGETTHDQYICDALVNALSSLIVTNHKPIGFGILTCQTLAQAKARAGGDKGNKGSEAMAAVVETLNILRKLRLQELSV